MNGHGGRATSLRTWTRGGGGGGRGGGGEGGEKMERMKRGGKDERRGAPVQPLFLFSLFSVVGKEFSVPWVVRERKVE